jgi:catechol 2,3-dioxygenase-like lactoylglutathione lyase family enzyme
MEGRPGGWAAAVAVAALAAIFTSTPHATSQAPAGLHFHHLHLRVADPAAAMARFARANGCAETILQGLGVGVRCGQAYLLFDRNDQAATGPTIRGTVTVSGSGEAALVRARLGVADPAAVRTWLRDRLGLDVPDALTFTGSGPAAASRPDEVAHIAFGAADPAPALARLQAAGVTVLSHSDDATTVAGPGGVPIEIVRDAGSGPDAFWCPMHPDVRSPAPGTCQRCGMTLVAIPPPVFGDYRMHVDLTSLGPTRGRLTIRLIDPMSGQLVTKLLTVHERLLHVFLVSRDLESFQHVHPDAAPDGTFTLDVTWPGPGVYALFADFYPAGGTPQMLQTTLVTPDYRGSAFPSPPALRPDAGDSKTADNLRVTLAATRPVAGREETLTFTLADARSGAAVTDLEPYLGAAGHLLVTSADLVDAAHTHPLDLGGTGPTVKFDVSFPRPGLHKMWVQFQRGGQVITLPFVVDVGKP